MNIQIRYYSQTGNTKQVAEAIGEQLGITAQSTAVPISEEVDVLFLGSAVYGADVDKNIKNFIAELSPQKVHHVACFSTATLLKSSYPKVTKLLNKQGISFSKQEFHCRGSFRFMHKGHPNANDLEQAKLFAKTIIQQFNEFKL